MSEHWEKQQKHDTKKQADGRIGAYACAGSTRGGHSLEVRVYLVHLGLPGKGHLGTQARQPPMILLVAGARCCFCL